MIAWFLILAALYVLALVIATLRARSQNSNNDDFMMAGKDLGFMLGCLTVAATLFSTFTLLGMPDFFRQHGVGAWIFLGVADSALVFCVIWFGSHLRRCVANRSFKGMAGLLSDVYGTRLAGYLYLAGIFLFLIPYVAVQIRGISIFMNAIIPGFLPVWAWATAIVTIMLSYSELGGLKAIIYADAIQGLILLCVTIFIAIGFVHHFGGVAPMFESVRIQNEALLTTPGPHGLFTLQFLLASFIAIVLISVTQPQMTIRFVIMRDLKSLHRMGLLLGVFAMLVIMATIPIGMYGATVYPELSTSEFLAQALTKDQLPLIAAAVAIGLIAAAISTADSQLFALGNELRSMLGGKDEGRNMRITKIAIVCFALGSLFVSIISSDQLVLLARVSFAGTAVMGPFIIAGVLCKGRPGIEILLATFLGLVIFLASVTGLLPAKVGFIRLDLLLFTTLFAIAGLSSVVRRLQQVGKPAVA